MLAKQKKERLRSNAIVYKCIVNPERKNVMQDHFVLQQIPHPDRTKDPAEQTVLVCAKLCRN